jgi:argininosuccinate lyase
LEKGLLEIWKEYRDGNFEIPYEDEDVHTRVEKLLTERYGDAAKKLHTARSRNDQILTDVRLYNKERLLDIAEEIYRTGKKILNFARTYENIPLCGYTHMQRAMPSSVGQWAMAFVEEIADHLQSWNWLYELNDASPLGSGAGYGVSIDIDRELSAKELGFSRVQINPIYCQNSRGKVEGMIIDFLSYVALMGNKIATDLLLFTSSEFGFFKADDEITTGSSIMPQKKNLDVMELVRGRTAHLIGASASVKSLVSNLISGYHRDLQDTKKMIIQAFNLSEDFLKVIRVTFDHVKPVEENTKKALDKTVFATDYAYDLVKQGIPFREAYRKVGSDLENLPDFDIDQNIKSKKHLGATGNLGIEQIEKRLEEHSKRLHNLRSSFRQTEKSLLGEMG